MREWSARAYALPRWIIRLRDYAERRGLHRLMQRRLRVCRRLIISDGGPVWARKLLSHGLWDGNAMSRGHVRCHRKSIHRRVQRGLHV